MGDMVEKTVGVWAKRWNYLEKGVLGTMVVKEDGIWWSDSENPNYL